MDSPKYCASEISSLFVEKESSQFAFEILASIDLNCEVHLSSKTNFRPHRDRKASDECESTVRTVKTGDRRSKGELNGAGVTH